ncbi:MAG: RNA 2',3'-cyclic phosphodiesterase [Patescibacteria group bacterium]|nr:RNA 2',3'-cyclic phosphodiesterase [Patescibacteria group bacterium]
MRLFLGIDVPEVIKEKIDKEIISLKRDYSHFDWIVPKNFHITLYFFGSVDNCQKIKQKVEALLWDQSFFYLHSFRLDTFVNRRLIVYLDFYREKEMERLVEKIRGVFGLENKNHHKFIPHLTLSRGPRSSKQQYFALKSKLRKIKIEVSFKVDRVYLFQSILSERIPIYKKIMSFELVEK